MKECKRCGQVKSDSDFYVIAGRLSSYCRSCTREQAKQYYYAKRDKRLEHAKKYNRTKNGKETRKRYYERHKEKISEYFKTYYARNKERILSKNRNWNNEHKTN